jgi:Mlc titration factor MtfA (ptsG expression regulator)
MEGSLLLAVLAATGWVAWRWPRWRLAKVLARPMDPGQLAVLRRALPVYGRMPPPLQEQLQKLVKQFLHQKAFVGCAGLEVTEEMRITIAAQACLLLLNRPSKVYPLLHTILVYPSAFMVPRSQNDGGIVTEHKQTLLGESWGDGRVVLSWDHVRHGASDFTDGQNVVLHEFAHQLDSESGSNNGAPFLGHRSRYQRWSQVLARNFDHLRWEAMYQQQGVMDHYGATSPAEFFAVATETFFEKPWQMAERHPELFEQFQEYYRVDPREWQPAPLPPPEVQQYGYAYGQWQ